jgi:hypothetical protein
VSPPAALVATSLSVSITLWIGVSSRERQSCNRRCYLRGLLQGNKTLITMHDCMSLYLLTGLKPAVFKYFRYDNLILRMRFHTHAVEAAPVAGGGSYAPFDSREYNWPVAPLNPNRKRLPSEELIHGQRCYQADQSLQRRVWDKCWEAKQSVPCLESPKGLCLRIKSFCLLAYLQTGAFCFSFS